MIQVLPQDQPLGARLAENILVPAGEGVGQGAANYTQNVQLPYLQQLANFKAQQQAVQSAAPQIQSAIDKLYPNPEQQPYRDAAKAVLETNAALGLRPDFSQMINTALNQQLMRMATGGLEAGMQQAEQPIAAPGQQMPQASTGTSQGIGGTPSVTPQGQPVQQQPIQGAPQSSGVPQQAGVQQPQQMEPGLNQPSPQKSPFGSALTGVSMVNPQAAQTAVESRLLPEKAEAAFQQIEAEQEQARNQTLNSIFEANPALQNETEGNPGARQYANQLLRGVNPNNREAINKVEKELRSYNRRMNEVDKIRNDRTFQTTGMIGDNFQKFMVDNANYFKKIGQIDEYEGKLKELGVDQLQRNEIIYPINKTLEKNLGKIDLDAFSDLEDVPNDQQRAKLLNKDRSKTVKMVEQIYKRNPNENFVSIRSQLNKKGVPDAWILDAYNNVAADLDFSNQPVDVPGIMSQSRSQILRDESAISGLMNYVAELIGGFVRQ